jgi:ferredoxin--NADP+ reductase
VTQPEDGHARVAVVGAGPAGFYAAEALLRAPVPLHVDMFERLPTPFGLVRYGVAPDHPKLKSTTAVFERIARSPGFRYLGNVEAGRDVSVEALRAAYPAVVLATGAPVAQRLEIPGIGLAGCHTAAELVGWYNGHPEHAQRRFDLSGRVAVVVGQGNVALDICRMLARPVEELRGTDIAPCALEALARSRIEEIHVVGRRGPVQSRFAGKELRELGELTGVVTRADADELDLNAESHTELGDKRNDAARKNLEILHGFAHDARSASRRINLRFLLSPVCAHGDGKVRRLVLRRNRLFGAPFSQRAVGTGEQLELPCDLLIASLGQRGQPIAGVPFDASAGVLPHRRGRVLDGQGNPIPGLYCVGWAKRGAAGIIGTNRACALETVESMLADASRWPPVAPEAAAVLVARLHASSRRPVSWTDWLRLDRIERCRGQAESRPRVKLASVAEMLAVL